MLDLKVNHAKFRHRKSRQIKLITWVDLMTISVHMHCKTHNPGDSDVPSAPGPSKGKEPVQSPPLGDCDCFFEQYPPIHLGDFPIDAMEN
jgi:hypothetical protein